MQPGQTGICVENSINMNYDVSSDLCVLEVVNWLVVGRPGNWVTEHVRDESVGYEPPSVVLYSLVPVVYAH